ncbi:MAG: hypothetical protein J5519_02325 [Bacteroidales bacterium]|nr:hypothetical protein [Bacteroidales bacterium]
MLSFLLYDVKAAVALAVFYMFYRLLLRKETFHRLNRIVLVGLVVIAFLLPLCIVTIQKPVEMEVETVLTGTPAQELAPIVDKTVPWWPMILSVLFWAGVALVLVRVFMSILCVTRIIRCGHLVREEDGCKIIVTERDIDPFSWMKYIVLSRKDWEGDYAPVITHEKAHIGFRHSAELLAVDILSAFQWFNPAIWMLRADLRELHEYEADDAVLRSGADIREYQYLLIRKAVSKSGYSVANSFNHSILKNRITMMSKSRSPLSRGLRALYLLPLVCLGIGLQARTVYVPTGKDSEKIISDEKQGIVLKVDADGKVSIDGKEMDLSEVEAYLRGQEPEVVHILADSGVKMSVVDELKQMLRRVGKLKIMYSSPSGSSGVTRHLPPFPSSKGVKVVSAQESFQGVNRDDILVVRINSAGRYIFGNRPTQDDEEMLRLGKGFLRERGRNARISLGCDRGASYGAYLHMQELLIRIYTEIREEKAQSVYGRSLSELTAEERSQINWQVPIGITEAEMREM